MPKVSIIVLTFNSSRFIMPCLDAVFSQDYRDFEVILVDNGSEDNSVSIVKGRYPMVRLIENKRNLGACAARNNGIEASSGKWILTLDCDVVLGKGFLSEIIAFAEESEGPIGIFQPKILLSDKNTIYSCGARLSGLRRFYDIGRGNPDKGKFNTKRHVFGACSAAALYRRQMLEEIKEDAGYFDERFFFLVEDVDLAWRAQKAGWKAEFYPAAVCYHHGNSSNFNKQFRQYLCFRNRYYMLIKNQDIKDLRKDIVFLFPYDFPRFIFLLLSNPHILKALREILSFSRSLSSETFIPCKNS